MANSCFTAPADTHKQMEQMDQFNTLLAVLFIRSAVFKVEFLWMSQWNITCLCECEVLCV